MGMASVIMLTGFAIIAVPTGIVTTELGREVQAARMRRDARSHCRRQRGTAGIAGLFHKCGECALAAASRSQRRNKRHIFGAAAFTSAPAPGA